MLVGGNGTRSRLLRTLGPRNQTPGQAFKRTPLPEPDPRRTVSKLFYHYLLKVKRGFAQITLHITLPALTHTFSPKPQVRKRNFRSVSSAFHITLPQSRRRGGLAGGRLQTPNSSAKPTFVKSASKIPIRSGNFRPIAMKMMMVMVEVVQQRCTNSLIVVPCTR